MVMEIDRAIESYLDGHWDEIVEDIATLVRIPSTEDMDAAEPDTDAPYGPEPKKALTAALRIARRLGFKTRNESGRIGWADLPGYTDTQLGIIAHVDVVPEGPGWTYPAFDLTRKDGYLVGRGVLDDKGPCIVALHAMKFWKDALTGRGGTFPYSIRFLFGANEETDMRDVAYYRERHADPAFLFTPDASFPVSYGEKGIYHAWVTSPPILNGRIVELQGGVAMNAVPGEAYAVLHVSDSEAAAIVAAAEKTDGISVSPTLDGRLRVDAAGRSAHAMAPEDGVNAIGLLADFILAQGICRLKETTFLEFMAALCGSHDGSAFDLQCRDDDFGPLTIVGSMAKRDGNSLMQAIDIRYPTTTDEASITYTLRSFVRRIGASLATGHCEDPFLMDKTGPQVNALLAAYNHVTGEAAEPFAMAGGTYARKFPRAASFGAERDGITVPGWSGGMHGPDEAVSESVLKDAFRIYVHAIGNLMDTEL